MNIPEEILKLPEKELKQVLTSDPKRATYFVQNNNILKVEKRLKGRLIFSDWQIHLATTVINKSHLIGIKPLTLENYKEELDRKKLQALQNASGEALAKYLTKVISYTKDPEFFDFETITDSVVHLVVHYPEVIITNSVELSHTMRDIYVRYCFYKSNTWILDCVYIGRTTFTEKEIQANYIFSHCNGDWEEGYTSSLCYGSDTPIRKLRNKLEYSLYNLSYFFVLFDEYLKWESIEGSPYKYIDNVRSIKDNFVKQNCVYTKEEIDDLISLVLDSMPEFTYQYMWQENVQTIVINPVYKVRIDELLTQAVKEEFKFIRHNNTSGYFSSVSNDTLSLDGSTNNIVWKGMEVPIRIIKDNVITEEKKVHIDILNEVINRITKSFEEFLIIESL